jgi:hypothetical protein
LDAVVLKLFPVIITVSPASPVNGENEKITGSVPCACTETTNEKQIMLTQINLLKDVVNKINLIYIFLKSLIFNKNNQTECDLLQLTHTPHYLLNHKLK